MSEDKEWSKTETVQELYWKVTFLDLEDLEGFFSTIAILSMLTEPKTMSDRKEEVHNPTSSRLGSSSMINYEMYDRLYEKSV